MLHRQRLNRILGRDTTEVARTLFIALVVLDVFLLGPWALRFCAGPKDALLGIASGGSSAIWGFIVACIGLSLATLLLWWTQAWLASRAVAAAVTDEMVDLVKGVLAKEHFQEAEIETWCSGLRRELGVTLGQLEYSPLKRGFGKPAARRLGPVAEGVVSTFCSRQPQGQAKKVANQCWQEFHRVRGRGFLASR